jgi:inosine-uridine nucleoside N-ribohydrolase
MLRPQKIIIDTDPGIDDALAIFLALASPELDVVGLTTVFGNADVELTTRNALALLEIAGRADIPVAKGAAKPLAGPYQGAVPQIHGEDGQGNAGVPKPTRKAVTQPAAEFLADMAAQNPGVVTIVAVGPLTNLALALKKRPQIAKDVKQVVIMGGAAFVPGNATPHAEANIFNDPEAADIVFAAQWPVVLVGLDVTHQAFLTNEAAETIMGATSATSRHIAKALPLYQRFFADAHQLEGVYLHDPSAVAYVVDKTLFKTRHAPLRVETEGVERGRTLPWTGGASGVDAKAWHGRRTVEICTGLDAPRLIDFTVQRLS